MAPALRVSTSVCVTCMASSQASGNSSAVRFLAAVGVGSMDSRLRTASISSSLTVSSSSMIASRLVLVVGVGSTAERVLGMSGTRPNSLTSSSSQPSSPPSPLSQASTELDVLARLRLEVKRFQNIQPLADVDEDGVRLMDSVVPAGSAGSSRSSTSSRSMAVRLRRRGFELVADIAAVGISLGGTMTVLSTGPLVRAPEP
mmetsp:Transcript_38343/g.110641  ORF Transcript_38343/g.110641 Transcript_38343/m.110641 type:complete len:201 (+) Transcript_38343:339-941(+)